MRSLRSLHSSPSHGSLLLALITLWLAALDARAASAREDASAAGGPRFEGRVTTRDGVAIPQARVRPLPRAGRGNAGAPDDGADDGAAWTDAAGRFTVPCDGCVLEIDHPRFLSRQVAADREPMVVILEPKQALYEEVEVTATRGGGALAPVSVASTAVDPLELAAPPSTLAEIVQSVAGVAENGQPGLFQVVAIRGVSRQRVLTFLGGVPLYAERRAGVAASFLDPQLFDSVDVVRGPSSTYYGSGALGGVLRIVPRRFDDLWVSGSWESFADESSLVAGWGDGDWSIGLAHRRANRDDVADGMLQNTGFEQTSAVASRDWSLEGGRSLRLVVSPSIGRDIGKPNSDFPARRVTVYPEEEHLVAELELIDDDGWSVRAFAHPNRLVTETLRPGDRISVVENEAFDFGASGERRWVLSSSALPDLTVRAGADWFARRGVDAIEVERDLARGTVSRAASLESARQDEAAIFGDARWRLGSTSLVAGARWTWQRQSNEDAAEGSSSCDDVAPAAFVGLVQPLGGGWELAANVGTGLRFPGLGERFFSGTTARGEIVGNPDLDPERSLSFDVGARFYGRRTFVAFYAFRLEIDDLIERVERSDGALAFVNLTSGRIAGLELEGFHQLSDRWRLDGSGHWLDGEADDGSPLSDVSPDRLQASVSYLGERWRGRLRWQHRLAKDDAGGGEMPIDGADVVSAAVARRLGNGLELELRGDNLLDEIYFASADDRSSAAPGRSIGLGFVWSP